MTIGSHNSSVYIELLKSFPPRPIASEEEFFAAQNVVDSLLDRPVLNSDEQDYLNVLGTLIHEYEEKQVSIPDIYGIELLKALMVEFGLHQKDLIPIFKEESIVSDVLNGQHHLTVTHIKKLARFFHISPAAFLDLSGS